MLQARCEDLSSSSQKKEQASLHGVQPDLKPTANVPAPCASMQGLNLFAENWPRLSQPQGARLMLGRTTTIYVQEHWSGLWQKVDIFSCHLPTDNPSGSFRAFSCIHGCCPTDEIL